MRYPSLANTNVPVNLDEVAGEMVRGYCGWHVSPSLEETFRLDGTGGNRFHLPSNHVENVHSVFVDGVQVNDYSFSTDGWVQLPSGVVTPRKPGAVVVTARHGWDYVPAVQSVIKSVRQRLEMDAGNVVSQRAGTQYVSYGSRDGESTGGYLLQTERAALAPYKLEQVI